MKKKVKSRKFPIEFDKNVLPKNVKWMHDFDYLLKLDLKSQAWMAKFIKEYINGNVKKGDRKALHKNAKMRKDCYQRKNAQNRDLMSILNANGFIDRIDNLDEAPHEGKLAFSHLFSKQRKAKP